MKKIEFRLSMPNVGSWNGKWTGEGRNYLIYKTISDKWAEKIGLKDKAENSWYYRWDDGWGASVKARVMLSGERKKKSDGFAGYDWMVESILMNNEISPKKN